MNPNNNLESSSHLVPPTQKRSVWQKLGGGSLSISLFLHVILLLIGVIWVFQIIPTAVALAGFCRELRE
jgi:hypothetical protein